MHVGEDPVRSAQGGSSSGCRQQVLAAIRAVCDAGTENSERCRWPVQTRELWSRGGWAAMGRRLERQGLKIWLVTAGCSSWAKRPRSESRWARVWVGCSSRALREEKAAWSRAAGGSESA